MALYIGIYEDYTVKKFGSIKAIVEFANNNTFRFKNAQPLTFSKVASALNDSNTLNLYDYDSETTKGVLTKEIDLHDRNLPDWYLKIQKLT
jgi:hypothetical protein